jgi:hypothetical protein
VGKLHRSKCLVVLAALAPFACSKDAQITTRTVTMHAPMACAPDASSYAVFQELGDFEPATPTTGYVVGDVGAVLPEIDDAAKALLVKATQNTSQSQSSSEWLGLGDVPSTGNVDVLLLPSLVSCAFTTTVGPRTQSVLGAIGGQRVLVVGGIVSSGAADGGVTSPSTFVVRLDTGEVAPVSTDLDLLVTPRIQATVTAFGDGGLVAGGVDPQITGGAGVLASAEVYVSAVGGFQQHPPILLSQPRAQHGAAVLLTGETLLVGGVGADGQTVLDTMEIVDPVTSTVRAENVATLAVARKSPTVLRLASGEIFVAGGFDANGDSVPTLEWFSADASQPSMSKHVQVLVAAPSARAFVALEAGGALAVIDPPAGALATFQSVWVIGADGGLTAAKPLAGLGGQPVLFGGAGGAPVLFVPAVPEASGVPGAPARWLRWQPYVGEFGVLGVDIAANVGDATASPDPGLAMWLDPTNPKKVAVGALRFDAIDDYSTLEGPLFVADTNDTAPDQLASAGGITFDPAVGLTLGSNASAFVTDRTYGDVTVDVDAPTGQPAILVLRDEGPDEAALLATELEVGGTSCPGALAAPSSAPSSLHVERTGASVVWSVAGGASGTCPTSLGQTARLSVGVRAPMSVGSVVRNLRVTRLGTP